MDFHLTEEQEMLRDGVSRFVTENYGFEVRRAVAASDPAFSAAQWQSFADLGWLGLTLPEDAGGQVRPTESATAARVQYRIRRTRSKHLTRRHVIGALPPRLQGAR